MRPADSGTPPRSARSESLTERPVAARPARGAVLGVSLGNLVELYDWSTYAAFATYFATQIFPPGNENLALLSTFMTYAVSFFLRPLGGWLIGRFADTRGRRAALMLSVSLMACGSLAIAVLPTYGAVGVAAPILLLLVRVVQGLALGGETTGAASYVTETAPSSRRGRYGALFYVSSGAATLLVALVGLVLTRLFTKSEMTDWAWRIPFVIGGLLGAITLLLRLRLVETVYFARNRDSARDVRHSTRYVLKNHWREGLMVLGVCAGGTVAYYTVFSALTPFSISQRGADGNDVFIALLVGTAIYLLLLYPFGMLSDRFGRKRLLQVFSVLAAIMLVFLNQLIVSGLLQLIVAFSIAGAVVAIFSAQNTILVAELFPTKVRAIGLGIWLNLCAAIFGGTAPFILQAVSSAGHAEFFFYYGAAVCLLGLATTPLVRDLRGRKLE